MSLKLKKYLLGIFFLAVFLIWSGCQARFVYFDHEQDLATWAVINLRNLYNKQDYEGLYALFTDEAQKNRSKSDILKAMKETYETWGYKQRTLMTRSEVVPGPVIQVRMVYNSYFEKGEAHEWFIWLTDGKQARLLQYQISPGLDNGTPIQTPSPQ